MKKIFILVNVDWFFISHRLCLAEEALKDGWEVYAAAGDTGRSKEIENTGITYFPLPMSRSGMNIFNELKTFRQIYTLYNKIKPDVVHQVALKPIVYGSFIAKTINIKGVLNSFSGLGYVFTDNRKSIAQSLIIKLMKYSFKRPNTQFIFQNKDDFLELSNFGIFNESNMINFIKGSGVDLKKFSFVPQPSNSKIQILFAARMLLDKGIDELRRATELLKDRYFQKVTFILAGMIDEENKAGVSESYLLDWADNSYVKWIGFQKDMISLVSSSDIVVLPSYREGMPKSLIEACAIGRPIVTTNVIGCRECVIEGENGFLVPIKSYVELAEKLEILILNKTMRVSMGANSRKKAEEEFGLKKVVNKHLEIYSDLLEKV